jgi:SAM-dependent methyltransferase
VLHLNRRRAEGFGEYAEDYDRSRPTYPSALVDAILPARGCRVLDVGCGTGKAALAFAARDCTVLGIEIDEKMAAVARRRGVSVEIAPFESWDTAGREFDLVVSGQAWHWIDPMIGPAKAADVLASHGRLAVFWNYEHPSDAALAAAVEATYETYAAELEGSGIGRSSRRRHDAQTAEHVNAIEGCGRFAACRVNRFPWTWDLRREEFIDLARTHSGVALLPGQRRQALLDRLLAVVGSAGEVIRLTCEAVCVVADKTT